ncbi:MAG: biotin--[acetyl-CoA-carboxylase] ligase [Candidatus Hermodarchaeota archaeon]|jgi:BirA family biotin operon repressor/biotin-[acetyl-CoA-carboxylase] ligase|nr:biotin--[acetyl-CoA-carboxylase] ligase [Candidatus Hermodarchaeota archaeon]
MTKPPIPFEPRNDPFQHALANTSKLVAKRLLHFPELPSTNTYLKEKGTVGEREGLVVLADTQIAGKGRFERSWHSPPGGLYFSILLRPMTISAAEAPLITLTAGVAVAKVLQTALGVQAKLKWPNDVLIENRKVCGILAESTLIGADIEYVVLGIGVNANTPLNEMPSDLQTSATTLQHILNRPVDLPRLFGYLLGQLEFWYIRLRDQGFASINREYRRLCTQLGKSVTVTIGKEKLTGVAKDIGADGSLVLHTDSGRKHIRSADILSSM